MKVYVLVTNTEGEPTVNMPVSFGRTIRAYSSERRAKVYARKFNCQVIEVDLEKGKIVYEGNNN